MVSVDLGGGARDVVLRKTSRYLGFLKQVVGVVDLGGDKRAMA